MTDRRIRRPLLRRHVRRRSDCDTQLGDRTRALVAQRPRDLERLRDPEVGHERVAVGQEDVLRLDVAMHDGAPVCVRERGGHLAQDAHDVRDRQLPLAIEPCTQALPLHVGHRVEQRAPFLPG